MLAKSQRFVFSKNRDKNRVKSREIATKNHDKNHCDFDKNCCDFANFQNSNSNLKFEF